MKRPARRKPTNMEVQVVGILKRTGTPNDNVFVNIEGFYRVAGTRAKCGCGSNGGKTER